MILMDWPHLAATTLVTFVILLVAAALTGAGRQHS